MCDELLMEAKPVFDHKSMIETVRDVLLNPDAGLRTEDKTSLLASVAEPQPKVEDWTAYLTWVADAALPDAVFTTLQGSMEDEDVVLFAVYTLCGWLEKDVARCTVEIQALRNIGPVMLQAAKRHAKNMVLVSKTLGVVCSLPDEILGPDKESALLIAEGLADVLASSHEHGTHRLWQMGGVGLVKVLSILAHKLAEWQLAETLSKYVGRLLKLVERNASHWEVFFVLQVISSFRVLLSQHVKLVVSACARVILAHTAGGSECSDRKLCAPDYETSPSWGTTMDLCLQIFTSMCLLPDRASQDIVRGVLVAGRALLNCYAPGRKLEVEARACLDIAAIDIMCAGNAVRACIEIVLSHPEYRNLVHKAVQLSVLLSFSPSFPRDDLYRNGSGAFALLELISQRQTTGLGSKEANDNEAEFQLSATALLMMLTSERRYKMGILGRGYEQLWSLVQAPSTLLLGLTALCHLSFDSPDAQEWLRKRGTDSDLLHLLREPLDLSIFKMILDILSEMQSPILNQLPDVMGVAQLTSIIFYFSPKLSDTELTRDNSTVVCAILKAITEAVIRADARNDDKLIKDLADCGYGFTLIQLLWFLDPETAIWKEAATAAFYFFIWRADTELETAQKWVLHVRRTAQGLDPNAKQYRKASHPVRLPAACMAVFGQQAVREMQVVVECKRCKKPVLMIAFANHNDVCAKLPPPPAPAESLPPPPLPPDAGTEAVPVRAAPTPPRIMMVRRVDADRGAQEERVAQRKEISVLEIRKDDDTDSKVTIMVETGPPVATSRANRSGGVPLASRRWTRRNKLTGLSLSFKIRGELDCFEEDEEEGKVARQGGDPDDGWAYTSERKRQGSPHSDTEEKFAATKRKAIAPPVMTETTAVDNSKRFFGALFGED